MQLWYNEVACSDLPLEDIHELLALQMLVPQLQASGATESTGGMTDGMPDGMAEEVADRIADGIADGVIDGMANRSGRWNGR